MTPLVPEGLAVPSREWLAPPFLLPPEVPRPAATHRHLFISQAKFWLISDFLNQSPPIPGALGGLHRHPRIRPDLPGRRAGVSGGLNLAGGIGLSWFFWDKFIKISLFTNNFRMKWRRLDR